MITFARFIDEARKFPHLNPKVSVNQAIADHLASASMIPGTRIKNSFTSFTAVDKLGINPQSKYNTPLGIYAYQNDYVFEEIGETGLTSNLPFAGDSPYANVFSAKGNIVHLNTMSSTETNNYYKKMIEYYLNTLKIRRDRTEWKTEENVIKNFIRNAPMGARFPYLDGGRFWYVSMKIKDLLAEKTNREAHIVWNSLFRGIGIDGFIDTGDGIIHTAEPAQAVFFSINTIVKNKRVNNKYSPDQVSLRKEIGQSKSETEKRLLNQMQSLETREEQETFVLNNPVAYKFLKSPSRSFEKKFFEMDPFMNIVHIKNPSEEIQIDAIVYEPDHIEFIKNPSEKAQMTAIYYNPSLIRFIKNPSEKAQLEAVRKEYSIINLIKNPSEKIQLAAVNNRGLAIEYIKNPSEKVQLAAVETDPSIIYLIKNPSEKVQLAAVNKNRYSYTNIKKPTPKVTALAKSLGINV